ncbi:MAG: formyltransferase family protein [Planctomycetota bacterium]|jgi:methionyl-tRNA formyltransferase
MKLFLIIDETSFYQPEFIARFMAETQDEVVGAALVTKVLPKSNIETYLIKHWYYLKFTEALKLGVKKYYYSLCNALQKYSPDKTAFSVRSVYEHYNIPYFEVEYNINKPEYLEKIKSAEPDVIVSSNSMIFGDELLSMPKIACINRHSALLPSYGGLWPGFQAMRSGDDKVGVSVHTMEKKIDKGILLAQKEIAAQPGITVDEIYQKCFAISHGVVLEALEKIRNNNMSPLENDRESSYFSFPTKEHWQELRSRGRKFI